MSADRRDTWQPLGIAAASIVERIEQQQRTIFASECTLEGIDPALGVSPSPLKSPDRMPARDNRHQA